MTTVPTSQLQGAALDWAVAKCEGVRTVLARYEHTMTGVCVLDAELVEMDTVGPQELRYSRDWAQGGPIIERELIRVIAPTVRGVDWVARLKQKLPLSMNGWYEKYGPTPLIAAMRSYVASKFGDEVAVPDELLS